MASEKRHMEYSIWSLFDAIWSTPCGHYFLPYGVLHVVTISYHMEYSMWSLFFAIWSTPCGHSGVHILTCNVDEFHSWTLENSLVSASFGLNSLGKSEPQKLLVSKLWKFESQSRSWWQDQPVSFDGLGLKTMNMVSLISPLLPLRGVYCGVAQVNYLTWTIFLELLHLNYFTLTASY